MTKMCFVISPIGEQGSPTRRHADQLLKHIIRPVAEELGYEVTRADQVNEAGMITHQIISRLFKAPLVIADLTEHNPNVFYELAVRHAAHLPLVHMARTGERLPFDIAGFRTIFFDLADPDSVVASKAALHQQIVNVGSSTLESPISVSVNLTRLEASGNPHDQTLAEVLQSVADLKAGMKAIADQLPDGRERSAMFNRAFLDDLRNAVPLSTVIAMRISLKKQGKEWRGLSPFKGEKTPSFYVNDSKRAWFDFSSGQNGDVFDWLMAIEDISFPEAVLKVEALVGHVELGRHKPS